MDPKIETRKDIYDDGALEAERVVRIEADGSEVNHGPYVRWHKNGLKAEEGVYENGLKVGRWRSWLDTGQNFFDGDYLVEGQPFSIEEPAPQPEAIEAFAGPALDSSTRPALLFEFLALMALVWVRPLAHALILYLDPAQGHDSWYFRELSMSATQMADVLVMLLVFYRSKEGFASFGLARTRPVFDVCLGVMLCLFMYESHVRALEYIGGLYAPQPGHFARPGLLECVAILIGLTLNSFAEEFAMRGYAMRRIAQFSRSFAQTLLVPAILFASYHIYAGIGHVIVVFGHGIVLGLAYWFTRRIWPTIIAHTLYNVALYARAYEFIT